MRHAATKLSAPARRDGNRVLHDAVEGQKGAVVEHDRIQLRRWDERLPQAIVDRLARKARIVPLTRETLLLCRSDDLAIAHECGGRVVIIRRYAEYVSSHAAAAIRTGGFDS